MSIPITIDSLMERDIVEWARIEFKEGWNPDTTLKTISAFANDIDNWGGGYIIIGIEEKNGVIKRPIKGLNPDSIDSIQKSILQFCKYIRPVYIPVTQPVYYENALLLLIWVPGGYERPYQCPKVPTSKNSEKLYYIRKLSSTIVASNADVKELISLSHNVPFDDRMNMNAEISDLKREIIKDYLREVESSLIETVDTMELEKLANDLRIANGPKEYYRPLNVGLLFFNDAPERFFPYTQIEVVNIPDPTGQGMEERIFKGPIHQQLKSALAYIKNNVIAEKVFKVEDKAEAERYTNYSYSAIEEFLSNAVYHKSYQINEPVTVRIEKESIEITNAPGPDRSISDKDIKTFHMRTRRYRNRRIGDFLKELHLIEGRNTGIPTALKAIKANKSPLPIFLTDKERSFFSVILPIHETFKERKSDALDNGVQIAKTKRTREELEKAILKELGTDIMSLKELYKSLGYTGNPSKTFKECINDLITKKKISKTTISRTIFLERKKQ